jgi:MFS family permease
VFTQNALQNFGFLAIAICSLLLALIFKVTTLLAIIPRIVSAHIHSVQIDHNQHAVLFVVLCILIISLNWGVNVSTYVLPAETYPAEIRSSFFGLSAAMGKIGALVGTYAFKPITDAWGFSGTYLVCAVISLLGVLCTHMFVEPYNQGSWGRGEPKGLLNDELLNGDGDDDDDKDDLRE